MHRLGTRSHQHDDAVGRGVADVFEQAVAASRPGGERLHRALDDFWTRVVKAVRRFPRLEEHVGILGGAAEDGAIRCQAAVAVGKDPAFRDQRAEVIVAERVDLRDFVRRAKAVEKVQEGDARLERRRVRHRGHVVGLLDGVRAQECKPRLAAGHHVGVIAEDRQRMRRQRARGHVHRERRELARDLVHVGDHQEQPLRGRERGRERPGLQGGVYPGVEVCADVDGLPAHPEDHVGENPGRSEHGGAFKQLLASPRELARSHKDAGADDRAHQDRQPGTQPRDGEFFAMSGPGQIGQDDADDKGCLQTLP